MSGDRWRRIEDICHDALERSPVDRAAFVRDACAGDDVLRGEVESLLANQSRADALGTGLGIRDSGLGIGTEELIGKQIGVYRIDSLLGAGGMGEVYRARDTKLGRDVAIKVLPAGIASDPERLSRFQREARVLASLNHPHIGTIHGFEESSGIAALVLELVEGPTLAERILQGTCLDGRCAEDRATDCRSARRRTRKRHHPSRSQAREHQTHGRRPGESAGLRAGEVRAFIESIERAGDRDAGHPGRRYFRHTRRT